MIFLGTPVSRWHCNSLGSFICTYVSDVYFCVGMAVQMLLSLRTEVTRVFVLRICSLMHTATSELVLEEDWEPVAAVQRISSPFTISSLPLRFQNLMVSALDHLTEYVSPPLTKRIIYRLINKFLLHYLVSTLFPLVSILMLSCDDFSGCWRD